MSFDELLDVYRRHSMSQGHPVDVLREEQQRRAWSMAYPTHPRHTRPPKQPAPFFFVDADATRCEAWVRGEQCRNRPRFLREDHALCLLHARRHKKLRTT